MNPLIYEDLKPTRDYLQDIAKIMGKLQQVFVSPAPHDWHKGLEVNQVGLCTQDLGENQRFVLDFLTGELSIGNRKMPLKGQPALKVFDYVSVWAEQNRARGPVEKPELVTTEPVYDIHQASELFAALHFTHDVFKDFSGNLSNGTLSPLLLYPHHFDFSLVWFPKDDDEQLGFGFSTGDSDVSEPYYYVTQYPEKAAFKGITLMPPGFWQSQGFSGAVLPYNDIALATDPRQLVLEFLTTLLAAY